MFIPISSTVVNRSSCERARLPAAGYHGHAAPPRRRRRCSSGTRRAPAFLLRRSPGPVASFGQEWPFLAKEMDEIWEASYVVHMFICSSYHLISHLRYFRVTSPYNIDQYCFFHCKVSWLVFWYYNTGGPRGCRWVPTGCCPKKGGATLLLQYHLFTISWNYIALKTASHNFGWWIGQCQSFPEATAHVNPKASVFHPKKHLASKLSSFKTASNDQNSGSSNHLWPKKEEKKKRCSQPDSTISCTLCPIMGYPLVN